MFSRSRLVLFTVGLLILAPSAAAHAQAWVDPESQLSVGVRTDYQTANGVWHGSTLVTGLPVQTLSSALSAQYVPIEKLALGLTLNGNGTRYSGPQMIPGNSSIILAHGSQDDGSFHWNVTDLDFEARYQVYDGAIAVSPALRLHTPLTDYENRGYAAAGIGLKELGLGVSFGRYGLGLDDLILQWSYAFTFVEKESGGGDATEQYRTNRSDADLSLSYIVTDKFVVAAGAAFRYTHDGFDLEEYPDLPSGDPLISWHDPVLKISYLAPLAVASYQISPSWSVSGRFGAVVWGQNASNPMLFGLSLGWASNLASAE